MKKAWFSVCFSFLMACLGSLALSATPPTIHLLPLYPETKLKEPLALASPPDGSGRLFVAERHGLVRILGKASNEPFLDLSRLVRTEHEEEGLLALAFDPGYKANGRFYVYHSASGPKRGVLARYLALKGHPDQADPASRRVLLEIPKPYGNHNGATLAFGPDGCLYLSVGDGGSGGDPKGNAQNLGRLLGKILRLDVRNKLPYAIPKDNPFAGRAGIRNEIWAFGLRNPWRMGFDRQTGLLWAGDVGQDEWEEIDTIQKGGNYGWNAMEGSHFYPGGRGAGPFVPPVAEYAHTDDNNCVIGGYVYRGNRFPALKGLVPIRGFRQWPDLGLNAGEQFPKAVELLHSSLHPSSFGEDEAGELYVVDFFGGVYRVEP